MLNLLFISDNPKVEYIKTVLQPTLKVIIDVVTDFDHGLKDVFEKRPATVCIQDQIGGVTGESVARHIQMLLGGSAPTFILLHDGSGKARIIKGLYDNLVDLGLSRDAAANEMLNTLKSLLGDQQWEKIYIPPVEQLSSDRSAMVVSEETREDADKLVDDLLSDLESSGFTAIDDQSPFSVVTGVTVGEEGGNPQIGTPVFVENSTETSEPAHATLNHDEVPESLLHMTDNELKNESAAFLPDDSEKTNKDESIVSPQPVVPSALPAAEFKVNKNVSRVEEQIPDDLLMAFEENYRSRSHSMVRVAIIVMLIIVAGGAWFYVKKKPQASVQSKIVARSTVATSQPAKADQIKAPASAKVIQPVVPQSLPTFIPKEGFDSSYAVQNSGWDRYVGKTCEFRIFRTAGRIQAIQVLSVKDAPISEDFIKSVFKEFAGSPDYQIVSRKTKAGVLVENGKILNNGEVIIYRKKGVVKAFVVSVN